MTERPKRVVLRISVFFCTGFMAISIGIVINFSISSALLPGHWVIIVTFVFVTSGNASIGVWIKLVIPAITAIVVQKKIKNLFRRENVMILSMNVCISSGYFNSLYTKRAFRSTIRSPSFKPDRR